MLSGLSTYLPESALTLFDNLEFFVRLLLSAGLGALVGLERSKRQKEAGVRTHCIIACTAALFMILSKYAFVDTVDITGTRGADPARIAAQVVSGISASVPSWTSFHRARERATKPPVIAAVRVPPSATSTSQSTMI